MQIQLRRKNIITIMHTTKRDRHDLLTKPIKKVFVEQKNPLTSALQYLSNLNLDTQLEYVRRAFQKKELINYYGEIVVVAILAIRK